MHRLLRRVWYLVRKHRIEADLAEEMATHRAMNGSDRQFGSAALAQNQSRDVWLPVSLQDIGQDVRFAARLLVRERWFTLVAAAVLGLGIGVDNTLLIAVNAVCLRGLPVPYADRVVSITPRDTRSSDVSASYREFEAIAPAVTSLAGMAAHATVPMSVGEEGRAPDRAIGTYISAGGFRLLGVQPILGRDFSAEDDREGAPSVTILGGGLWASRYGSDRSVIGRTIRLNGTPSTVIGVMQPGFKFPRFTELWQPLHQMPGVTVERRSARQLGLFGRLGEATTAGEVAGQLERAGAQLTRDHPDTNQYIALTAKPINESYNQKITAPEWIGFLVIGAVVLVIACANVANLLLMRSAQRAQEFAIRASLGASRMRLVRQLLIESVGLAALGGIAGAALAILGGQLLTGLVPETQMPFWVRFTMDGRMLAVLSAVTLSSSVIFGMTPALHVSRTDVNTTLKEGGRSSTSGALVSRWTHVLLVAEFALSVMLVAMLVKGERTTRAADRAMTVFDTASVVTGSISLPLDRYRTSDERLAVVQQIENRLNATTPVTSVAFAAALPGGGAASRTLDIDGRPATSGKGPVVFTLTISPRYFETLGVALVRGRPFNAHDGVAGDGAAIVNQRFVEMFMAGGDPLGQRIRLVDSSAPAQPAAPWLTINGVSPILRQRPVPEADPIVYLPMRGGPLTTFVTFVRGSADTTPTAVAFRDIVRAIDAELPVARLMPMDQAVAEAQWAGRGSTLISETIVLIAMLLAATGLYAVTAHAVVLRAPEISVRRALGARAGHIVWMVWRRAATQIGVGAAVGVACSIAWDRLMNGSSASYRLVDPIDLGMIVVMVATLGLTACLVPALRAVRLDPLAALRRQ